MEWVAYVAGRPHTDRPPCVSNTIAAFLRSGNDAMNDDDRQMLKPLIPRVIGTAGTPEQELRRSWMALDWHCRVSTPAWLRLAGLTAEAEAIEATAPIVDSASAQDAQAALDTARDAARKLKASAYAASASSAYAASAYASYAASAASAYAASAYASYASSSAASAAYAAYAAAYAASAYAAYAASAKKLRPTVEMLQASAIELIERMIAVTAEAAATAPRVEPTP